MEANEKNEMLSKLYAIRAGMSSVSMEKDKVASIDKKLEKAKKDNKAITKKLESKIKSSESSLETEEWCSQTPYLYGEEEAKKLFWLRSGSILSFALGGGLLLVAPIVTIPLAICGGVFWRKGTKQKREMDERRKKNVANRAKRIVSLKAKIESDTASLEKEKEDFNKLQAKTLEDKTECIAVANNMYNVILDEYRALLDPRDWQYIDIIIFCFETGRADNLKEALLWVDRQVQTNQIISAVNTASMQIQNTIQSGFQQLRVDMVKCFSVISNQLEGISNGISEISNGIDEQNVRIAQLTKKVDLNNALLKKASLSSSQLAQDVHYMRELAENKTLRNIGK